MVLVIGMGKANAARMILETVSAHSQFNGAEKVAGDMLLLSLSSSSSLHPLSLSLSLPPPLSLLCAHYLIGHMHGKRLVSSVGDDVDGIVLGSCAIGHC